MAKNVLIVIGLLALGVLVFCLCCYKVTNLLYQLFTIDSTDHTEMVSPSHLSRHEKKLSPPPPPHQLSSNEKSGPPDYHDLPHHTPRCSRHAAQRSSKEELAMVNINNFPSVGDLREPGHLSHGGYTSVERLLPPFPSYSKTSHYRKTNGAAGSLRSEDNPTPSYSYSYTNINCGQDPPGATRGCPRANSKHQPLPHNFPHIATLRRTPGNSHQDHSRWCSNGVGGESPHHHHHQHQHHQHLPPSSRNSHSSYEGPISGGPLAREVSRESVEDREVRAMFHRDTLLARIVR